MKMMRIVQCNLHRCHAAMQHLVEALRANKVGIALVQEPTQINGRIGGIGKDLQLFYIKGLKKVRKRKNSSTQGN